MYDVMGFIYTTYCVVGTYVYNPHKEQVLFSPTIAQCGPLCIVLMVINTRATMTVQWPLMGNPKAFPPGIEETGATLPGGAAEM